MADYEALHYDKDKLRDACVYFFYVIFFQPIPKQFYIIEKIRAEG